MKSGFLPWTSRGVRYASRAYLSSVDLDAVNAEKLNLLDEPFSPETIQHLRALAVTAAETGERVEFGAFSPDGSLLEPELRKQRQGRNILYYSLRDFFNIRRGHSPEWTGSLMREDPLEEDAVGNWAVLVSERCPHKSKVIEAIAPLVEKRHGEVIELEYMDPDSFCRWLVERVNAKRWLPDYLLICDNYQNIPLEYQVLLNSISATGRVWWEDPQAIGAYVDKTVGVESGERYAGVNSAVGSPVDDPVTEADYDNIITELLDSDSLGFSTILARDFSRDAIQAAASEAGFLAIYCHGLGLSRDEFAANPSLQGAFVLDVKARQDDGLLTSVDVEDRRFCPGGILFTPACLAGGTVGRSDFMSWLDPRNLAEYVISDTHQSELCSTLLKSASGPLAILAHFDISIASNARMFNPITRKYDLQAMLHQTFVNDLAKGSTIGRASRPFRWAAGAFYAQAIYIFGQITGIYPIAHSRGAQKTLGTYVSAINRHYVTATDMRNYVILGDPAVRLPSAMIRKD